MKWFLPVVMLAILAAGADADVLYQQPPDPGGGFYHSSWWDPDGSNYDEYVWDRFVLASSADVDSIEWRGTYDPAYSGAGGPVVNFTVGIYGSIPGGSQPDFSRPPLVEYDTGDNGGETYVGVVGGATMYDYRFTLPAPFPAQAGVPYWVHIEAWPWGFPDWSIARGTGGDGYHFRCQHVTAKMNPPPTGCYFTAPSGDAAFKLLTPGTSGVEGGQGPADFVLRGPSPNPSRGDRLEVSFRLPDAAPAQLALFDAAGRRVTFREIGAPVAGPQVVDLAPGSPLEPGVYFARLSQGGRLARTKLIVLPR